MEQNQKTKFFSMKVRRSYLIPGIIVVVLVAITVIAINNSGNETNSQSAVSPTTTAPSSPCDNLSSLKQNAQAVDYKQLEKNPDSFNNTSAKFTGQVLQIQESGNEGYMRLAVTKDSYGYNSGDVVLVEYNNAPTSFVNDDIVTVYGTLTGSQTYTSAANFKITVPSMIACDMVKASTATSAATPKTEQPASVPKQTPSSPAATQQPTPSTQEPTTPTHPPTPKSWHTVQTFSNIGDGNTQPFHINGSMWKLDVAASATNSFCQQYPNSCGINVQVYQTDGTYVDQAYTSKMGASYNNSAYIYSGAGDYYLKITTANLDSYSITVEDNY